MKNWQLYTFKISFYCVKSICHHIKRIQLSIALFVAILPDERVICISVFNKNLAIANRSRVSCAHNTLRALIGLNITP